MVDDLASLVSNDKLGTSRNTVNGHRVYERAHNARAAWKACQASRTIARRILFSSCRSQKDREIEAIVGKRVTSRRDLANRRRLAAALPLRRLGKRVTT